MSTQEDYQAMQALHELVYGLAKRNIKSAADFSAFTKEFDSIVSQVFQPQGGSENFTNLRTPGTGPGKVPASPGHSGDYDKPAKPIDGPNKSAWDKTGFYDSSGEKTGSGYVTEEGRERYGSTAAGGTGESVARTGTGYSNPYHPQEGTDKYPSKTGFTSDPTIRAGPGESGNYGESAKIITSQSPTQTGIPTYGPNQSASLARKSRYTASEAVHAIPMPDGTLPGTEATRYQYKEKSASLFPTSQESIDTKGAISSNTAQGELWQARKAFFEKDESAGKNATALVKSMTRVAFRGTGDDSPVALERLRKSILMEEEMEETEEIGSPAASQAAHDLLLPKKEEEEDESRKLEEAAKSADSNASRFETMAKDVTVDFTDRARATEYAKNYRQTAMKLRRKARRFGVGKSDII